MKNSSISKLSILAAFSGMLFFQSCNKSNIDPNSAVSSVSSKSTTSSKSSEVKTPVAQANLLPAITSFLKEMYPDSKFNSASSETVNNELFYYVNITDDGNTFEIVFDKDGEFYDFADQINYERDLVLTNVPQASLMPVIVTYLNENYKGYTFVKANSESNLTEKNYLYSVVINVGGKEINVLFDNVGEFLAETSYEEVGE